MDISDLKEELKALVNAVHGNSERIAVITEIIKTHEARSIALQVEQKKLEARFEPVVQHVAFMSMSLKGLGAIALGVLIQLAVKFLL